MRRGTNPDNSKPVRLQHRRLRATQAQTQGVCCLPAVPPAAGAAASKKQGSQTLAHQGWCLVLHPPQILVHTLSKSAPHPICMNIFLGTTNATSGCSTPSDMKDVLQQAGLGRDTWVGNPERRFAAPRDAFCQHCRPQTPGSSSSFAKFEDLEFPRIHAR